MSDSDDNSELIEVVSQLITFNYALVSVTAFIAFEYCITFNQEIETVWRKKFTATSLLLVTTRWVMIINQIFIWITPTPSSCYPVEIMTGLFLVVGFIQNSLFSALRVYALWDRSIVLFVIVFALGIVPMGTDMYTWIRSTFFYDPFFGCSETINYSDRLDLNLTYITRAALMVADTIVLVCTWIKTYHLWRRSRRLGMSLSISTCLLRDGTIYFVLLLAINIIQVVTFNSTAAPLGPFITEAPSVLMCRFIMNLRQAGSVEGPSSFTGPGGLATIDFSATALNSETGFIGDIGNLLSHEPSESSRSGSEDSEDYFTGDEIELAKSVPVHHGDPGFDTPHVDVIVVSQNGVEEVVQTVERAGP